MSKYLRMYELRRDSVRCIHQVITLDGLNLWVTNDINIESGLYEQEFRTIFAI